jgi:signal transduction histidine kinase
MRERIAALGGSVVLDGDEHRGCELVIRLPLAPPNPEGTP